MLSLKPYTFKKQGAQKVTHRIDFEGFLHRSTTFLIDAI
jgi:hypothetical protein